MSGHSNENWLRPGGLVPVDIPTTGALVMEIQRLRSEYMKVTNELDDMKMSLRRPSEAVEKDAARYRWLCDGNGYFMEENSLCGHYPDKARADAAIDAAMRDRSDRKGTGE